MADILCPSCHNVMKERKNNRTGESFLGCSKYPACKATKKITPEVAKELGRYVAPEPKLRTRPPGKSASNSKLGEWFLWKFFTSIGVTDLEIIFDTLLEYCQSRKMKVKGFTKHNKFFERVWSEQEQFKAFAKQYLKEINISYNEQH